MNLMWGEKICHDVYPLIKDLHTGEQIENKLLEHFTPSFFSENLCESKSLIGRVSSHLFFICEKLCLDKIFACFNRTFKLCCIVLKAERHWLADLLDEYEESQQNLEKVNFVARHLSNVVKENNEIASNEEIQNRLNKLVALLSAFYGRHGKGHNYVTGRVPKTYFQFIFSQ